MSRIKHFLLPGAFMAIFAVSHLPVATIKAQDEPVDNVCENQCTMGITWMQHALDISPEDAQTLWEACTGAC